MPIQRTQLGKPMRISKLSSTERIKSFNKNSSENTHIPRNKAIKYLQCTASEFRRLCIISGVFPRTPGNQFAGNVAYYLKADIKQLSRSNLLETLRSEKAYKKRAISLKQQKLYEQLKFHRLTKPSADYSSLILSRYPTFQLALADLDDCLSLISLCTGSSTSFFTPQLTETCTKLRTEFDNYISCTNSLLKTFISVKGFYFQAAVHNQVITWLEPHRTSANPPDSVETSVLCNFIEFYAELLKFVNFRLYSEIGIKYPPESDKQTYRAQNKDFLQQIVFKNLRFHLSRETPSKILELIIISAGGELVDNVQDATHCIIDRPVQNIENEPNYAGKDIIQPQFVFDSFNLGCLLPSSEFAPGNELPPHLSPFEFDFTSIEGLTGEDYIPDRLKELVNYYNQFVEKTRPEILLPETKQEAKPEKTGIIGQSVKLEKADEETSDSIEERETDTNFAFFDRKQDLELDDNERMIRAGLSKNKRELYDKIMIKEKQEKLEREKLIRRKLELKEGKAKKGK
ncbi:Pescadillo cell cycle regulator [Spironucleus salmonicida]|uniref:Pescadillo cell cycle regulator n=1 Tax=Spironucleus salmonicida TaxID=348837 RepID=V6LJX1_9EUKA|nr:Pescadillo cell cycle regulator [Spironucleus salmonicida]|eukprot:EST44905.1 Pescadillo cell cycle regulator [Spironucleus salmonicida]